MMAWLISGLLVLIILGLVVYIRRLQKTSAFLARVIEQHVAEVDSMYRQMRGIRHDYKNQLQIIKTHLQWDQLSELKEYLNQMEHELNTVDTIVQTGNVAIDAIVNSKLTLARDQGIALNAKAIVPSDIPFSSLDMGILIGNLLSNAYESALKTDEPFIRLYIAPIKGNLYISCTNSTSGKVESLITTKLGLNHGFGIGRIDQIVTKYGGWITRASEHGVFASEITLPLVSEKQPLVGE